MTDVIENKVFGEAHVVRATEPHQFIGCEFKRGLIARDLDLQTPLVISSCLVHGDLDLSGTVVVLATSYNPDKKAVDLSKTTVHGSVDLRGLKASGKLCANRLTVSGGIQASDLKTSTNRNVAKRASHQSVFKSINSSTEHRPPRVLQIRPARTVVGSLDLTDLDCHGTVNFGGAFIGGNALFVNASIGGSCRLSRWPTEAYKTSRTFRSEVQRHTVVAGDLDFHGSHIHSDLSLRGIQVHGTTILTNAHIEGMVVARSWLASEREDPVLRLTGSVPEEIGFLTAFHNGIRATRLKAEGLVDLSGAYFDTYADFDLADLGGIRAVRLARATIGDATINRFVANIEMTTPFISEDLDKRLENIRSAERTFVQQSDNATLTTLSDKLAAFEPKPMRDEFPHLFGRKVKRLSGDPFNVRNTAKKQKGSARFSVLWLESYRSKASPTMTQFDCKLSLRSAELHGDLEIEAALLLGGLDISGITVHGGLVCRGVRTSDDDPPSGGASNNNRDQRTPPQESEITPTIIRALTKGGNDLVSILAENATIGRYVSFSGTIMDHGINMLAANIGGNFLMNDHCLTRPIIGTAHDVSDRLYSLRLSASTIGGNVSFEGAYCEAGISLENSTIKGDIVGIAQWLRMSDTVATENRDVETFTPRRRTYIGPGWWTKGERASLLFNGLDIQGDIDLRGCYLKGGILLQSAHMGGSLMLQGYYNAPRPAVREQFSDPVTWFATSFIGQAVDAEGGRYSLFLNGTTLEGDIDLRGSILTSGIRLSNVTSKGHLNLIPFEHRFESKDTAEEPTANPQDAHKDEQQEAQSGTSASRSSLQTSPLLSRTIVGVGTGSGFAQADPIDSKHNRANSSYPMQTSIMATGATVGGYIFAQGSILLHGIICSRATVDGNVNFSPYFVRSQDKNGTHDSETTYVGFGSGLAGTGPVGIRFVGAHVKGIFDLTAVTYVGEETRNGGDPPVCVSLENATVEGTVKIDDSLTCNGVESPVADCRALRCHKLTFRGVADTTEPHATEVRVRRIVGAEVLAVCFAVVAAMGGLLWAQSDWSVVWLLGLVGGVVLSVLAIRLLLMGTCASPGSYRFSDVASDAVECPAKNNQSLGSTSGTTGRHQWILGFCVAGLVAIFIGVVWRCLKPGYGWGVVYVDCVWAIGVVLLYIAHIGQTNFVSKIMSGFSLFRAGAAAFATCSIIAIDVAFGLCAAFCAFLCFIPVGYELLRSRHHGFENVLAKSEHDECIFGLVEGQLRRQGRHGEADAVSMQWQRLQFLRSRQVVHPLGQVFLHFVSGHGVRVTPFVSILGLTLVWGTCIFGAPRAVRGKDVDSVETTPASCGPPSWSFVDGALLTLRYFVPWGGLGPQIDYEASGRSILIPGVGPSDSCTSHRGEDVDRPATYQDFALGLSICGWLCVPLVIGSFEKFVPRLRSRKV